MNRKVTFASGTIALVALALALSGCGGKKSASPAAGSTDTSTSTSAPFDRSFIDAMVPHHRSAVAMAEAAQKAGLGQPALISVALNIVDSQKQEIDQMLGWRKQWYGSAKVDPNGADGLGMSMKEMGMAHGEGDIASAKDVDSAFASMMSDHHKGAIAMARLALERGQHPEIKSLARRIIAAQARELKVMKPYATAMGGMHM